MQITRYQEVLSTLTDAKAYGVRDGECPCCCGEPTKWNHKLGRQSFRPGHDSRLVSKFREVARDQSNDVTVNDLVAFLEDHDLAALGRKLLKMWTHFPANGPTNKAARKLIQDVDVACGGKSYIQRFCGRRPEHAGHADALECARWMVLNDMSASTILRAMS